MSMATENRVDRRRLEPGLATAIFLGLFVYAWKGIQSHLLYYGFGVFTAYPVFSWEGSSLRATFGTPGGPLNALAAVLAQTYRDPLLGALAIVAVLVVLFAGIRRLLRSVQGGRLRALAWVPVILALMIYTRYDNPLAILLAIGLSIWMVLLYGGVAGRTLPMRAGVFLALFAAAYYLAGASALVFACIVCLTEALVHRRVVIAVVQAILACGGAFLLGWLIFGLEPRTIYTIGTFWDPSHGHEFSALSRLLTAILYALVPALIPVAFLGRVLAARAEGARPGLREKHARPARDAQPTGRWAVVRMVVVTVTAVLCVMLSRNHIRSERSLHYYAHQRDWDCVIALAHRMRGTHAFTPSGVFDVNRALAHRGLLSHEVCVYPQDETKTLFLSFEDMPGRFQHAKQLELYLDLGCPNAAEKNAYELLDNEGPSPYVLEAMVRIHLAKGQAESARIVLQALQKHAGGREAARRWQDIVADPARAESHPLVQAWRRVRGSADSAVGGIAFEPMLKRLLADTPDHRLAFEYLMAHYLLKHQRAELVSCLPLLRPLGYTQLPRQVAEAVLVHALETKTSPQTLGWTIEPAVQTRFREIADVVKNARGNSQAAFDILAPRYGDTYTFYSMFNVCGAK
jgi:hypothetical protein